MAPVTGGLITGVDPNPAAGGATTPLSGIGRTPPPSANGFPLRGRAASESGGLSGAPLFAPSTEILRAFARAIGKALPLIGVGGVASGAQAYAKLRAGASAVQLYTGLIYHGPGLVARIGIELAACLRRDGLAVVADAVGLDA